MEFSSSPEQERIKEAIAKLCERFGDDYWLKRDREGGFPADFHHLLDCFLCRFPSKGSINRSEESECLTTVFPARLPQFHLRLVFIDLYCSA